MDKKTKQLIDTWRDKLDTLLVEAREAAKKDDLDTCIKVAEKLQDYIISNPLSQPDVAETAAFDEMDKIARNAHDALLLDNLSESVGTIVSQSAELAGLIKKIQVQTAQNEKTAKSLRFEKAQKVVASLTDTVSAVKDLKAQIESQPLTEAGLADLAKKLGTAVDTLQALRTEVEGTP